MLKVYYLCNKSTLGIERIGLFGSFARDEGRSDSDIDIIITLAKPDLFQYSAIKEMNLLLEMSKEIHVPDDFVSSTSGLIIFRACSMSLQYITESFVKIRNLCGNDFFKPYKAVPWPSVFGMRNFLSNENGESTTGQ